MNNCIFCKIINGDIPSTKIYEDDEILAFLDISQATIGHTLVIPKAHIRDIFEMEEETASNLYRRVPKLASAIKHTFNAGGMNIVNNNKEEAGQTIFHYHLHLIPRYSEKDGLKVLFTNNMDRYSKEDLEDFANRIKKNL